MIDDTHMSIVKESTTGFCTKPSVSRGDTHARTMAFSLSCTTDGDTVDESSVESNMARQMSHSRLRPSRYSSTLLRSNTICVRRSSS